MLNKVMLIGYVGADSEMKFTAAGIPLANFSLAVNETYKNGGGEKKTNTLWIHCVAWRRWAEIVGEHVTKGKFLYVEGRLLLAAARMGPLRRGQLGPKRRCSMAASAGTTIREDSLRRSFEVE